MLNSDNRDERVEARRACVDPTPTASVSLLPRARSPSSRPLAPSLTESAPPPAAHAARVAAREAEREGQSADSGDAPAEPAKKKKPGDAAELTEDKRQILESKRRLDRLRAAGSRDVTVTRVALDDRENRRRIEDERRRDELRDAIAVESAESAAANADVAARWGDLFDEETPQALRDALDEQRRRCDAVLASKVAIEDRLRAELEAKDDAYVETLKKQAADVDELLLRMGRQFRELRAASLAELDEIERAFLELRAETLTANAAEIDALFDDARRANRRSWNTRRSGRSTTRTSSRSSEWTTRRSSTS